MEIISSEFSVSKFLKFSKFKLMSSNVRSRNLFFCETLFQLPFIFPAQDLIFALQISEL